VGFCPSSNLNSDYENADASHQGNIRDRRVFCGLLCALFVQLLKPQSLRATYGCQVIDENGEPVSGWEVGIILEMAASADFYGHCRKIELHAQA